MALVIGMTSIYRFQCTTVHRVPCTQVAVTPLSVSFVTLRTVNARTPEDPPGAQAAHAAGPAGGRATPAGGSELLRPEPARGHARGRRRARPPSTGTSTNMEELGLALIDESFRTLREMIRAARADPSTFEHVIRNSVDILVRHVHENRLHFTFIARERFSGVAALTPRDPHGDPAVRERPGHRPRSVSPTCRTGAARTST